MTMSQSFLSTFFFTICIICSAVAQSSFRPTSQFIANHYADHDAIRTPRSIKVDASGDILVVSRNTSQVIAIYREGQTLRTTVIVDHISSRLNHGLALNGDYLYASNSSTVLRWRYQAGQRRRVTSDPEIIVRDIPSNGNHVTRTLIFDHLNRLYVSVGSFSDIDEDATRAKVRRFDISTGVPPGGFQFQAGEVFADGVRNIVGMAIDSYSDLWGVDCGIDDIVREDLGADIHITNPADEVLKFDFKANYGYPYCWTVDRLQGHIRGQQLSVNNTPQHGDAYCNNSNNNRPPTLPISAHSAPLGITFFDGRGCDSTQFSFPCSWTGDIFVALHGSSNINPPSGYKVVRIPIEPASHLPTGEILDIIVEPNPASCGVNPSACFRPVDLVFSKEATLLVTSDSSNEVIQVLYFQTSSGWSDNLVIKLIYIPGVIAAVFSILITLAVLGIVIYAYCKHWRVRSEVPYVKQEI